MLPFMLGHALKAVGPSLLGCDLLQTVPDPIARGVQLKEQTLLDVLIA
jgi:hypothetical protein